MKYSIGLAALLICCASTAYSQNAGPVSSATLLPQNHASDQPRHAPVPAMKMADVKSIEAIVAALYDVISGPAGHPRDWDRLRDLCIPEVRFIQNTRDDKGHVQRTVMTFDDFKSAASDVFSKEDFFERGVHNQIDRFGTIAQVFSTYASSREKNGTPFERGINSMQFVYDGQRWWCVTILWDKEGPGNPIPPQYLK